MGQIFRIFPPAGQGEATFSYPLCFFRAASAPEAQSWVAALPGGPGQRGVLGFAAGGAWGVRALVFCERGAELWGARVARASRALRARCARAARAARALGLN